MHARTHAHTQMLILAPCSSLSLNKPLPSEDIITNGPCHQTSNFPPSRFFLLESFSKTLDLTPKHSATLCF